METSNKKLLDMLVAEIVKPDWSIQAVVNLRAEVMRRMESGLTPLAVDVANAFCKCVDPHFDIVESCSVCGKPPRH